MKRSALRRGSPLRRVRPTWSVEDVARKLWREGMEQRCAMIGQRRPDGTAHRCLGPLDAHHVVKAQTLRSHGFTDYVYDRRGRMPLCRAAHEAHHAGRWPVPRSLVPGSAIEMAVELGLLWAIEKAYPFVSLAADQGGET